jgi:hypothetical protein
VKRIVKALAISAIVTILVPGSVLAADYTSDAANALQHSSVYVAPGTDGTNANTVTTLAGYLNSDDNIVLVMLPSTAEAELGVDITTIASRLSEKLGNQKIIGLSVGNKVVGYAPTLPDGVATDRMRRAQSVTNDPVTALGTFAQNVHIWQKENPQTQPTPSIPGTGFPLWILVLIGVVIVISGICAYYLFRDMEGTSSTYRTRFNAPAPVRDLLRKIAQKREQVEDVRLRSTIYQICVDIEKYFQSSSSDKTSDSSTFSKSLTEVDLVLAKYIDVQNNRRYYKNPDDLLDQGEEALVDFAAYVLDSIRSGNEVALRAYKLKAYILQAQRSAHSLE